MHEFEHWVYEHFSVVESDSVSRSYSEAGPPSWRGEWRQLAHDLDPAQPADWWWMVCLMDLRHCLTAEMRVLDLGCGPGCPSIFLSPFVSEIVAIDVSKLALKSTNIGGRYCSRCATASLSAYGTMPFFCCYWITEHKRRSCRPSPSSRSFSQPVLSR